MKPKLTKAQTRVLNCLRRGARFYPEPNSARYAVFNFGERVTQSTVRALIRYGMVQKQRIPHHDGTEYVAVDSPHALAQTKRRQP